MARAGSRKELLTSLKGKLETEVGPGRIYSKTFVGDALFNLISILHLNGILSGEPRDAFATDGIPYDTMKVNAEFQAGSLTVDQLKLSTPAMTIAGTGTIDLVQERLKMQAGVAVLKTADQVLGFVPLVGKLAKNMTEVHVDVEGPVDKPTISIRPAEGLTKGIEDEVKEIGTHIKGLFKRRSHHSENKTIE